MIVAPFDNPIVFDNLEGFTPIIKPMADGMRASLAGECPSCAIIQFLNPKDERVFDAFNPGVATLGHLVHQAWSWQSFGPWSGEHIVEQPIVWKHGVSHEDTVVTTGKYAGQYEVKSHSEKKPQAPKPANYRQVEFRMRLRELAGMPLYGPTRIITISTAGKEKGWVRGPWDVTLTDERRAEIDATLADIDYIIERAKGLDLHNDDALKQLANGCTTCFPKPVVGASGFLSGWLRKYATIKAERDEYDAKRKQYLDARKSLDTELDEARTKIESLMKRDDVKYESLDGITATYNRAGNLVINTPRDDAENAA